MAQVLPSNRRASFTEGLLGGLTQSAPDALQQLIARREQMQQLQAQQEAMSQENQALSQQYGVDLAGISNPKLRELAVKDAQKQRALSSLIGGGQEQSDMQGQITQVDPLQQRQQPAMNGPVTNFSPQQLATLAAYDPQLAAQLQRSQDSYRKAQEHAENIKLKKEISDRDYSLKERSVENVLNKDAREYAKSVDEQYQGYLTQKPQVEALEAGADDRAPLAPFRIAFAEWAGIPESAVLTVDEEAQQKISTNLLRGISQYFPGRILQSEVESFLKGLPTLMNSKEGQKRVARLVNVFDSMKKDVFDLKQQIIKENNGKIPENLQSLILEKMQPISDRISSEARDIMRGEISIPNATQGQKITREIADKLISKFGNKEAARAEAKRLGYEF